MNVILLRYTLFTAIAGGLLVLCCVAFYFILVASQSSSESRSTDNSSKAAAYAEVRKQADEYRTNLTIANQVLDKGVNYTSVIFAITDLLPSGVIFDNLSLAATDFGNKTTFTAKAKSYDDATKLKESFEKSDIFSDVRLDNLTDTSNGQDSNTNPYPINVAISATLKEVVKQ